MPTDRQFRYWGVAVYDGRAVREKCFAPNATSARRVAKNNGVIVRRIREVSNLEASLLKQRLGKPTPKELAEFTRALAQAVKSGADPIMAFEVARQSVKKRSSLSKVASEIIELMRNGETAVIAVGKYRNQLGPTAAALFRVGLATGNLVDPLISLSETTERKLRIRSKIMEAATYPVLMLSLSMILLGAVLTQMLPEFVKVMQDSGIEIPAVTLAMLSAVNAVQTYWLFGFTGILMLIVAYSLALRKESVQLIKSKIALKIPFIGKRIKSINMIAFCSVVGVLLRAGISDVQVFSIASETLRNKYWSVAVSKIPGALRNEANLSDALRAQSPPLDEGCASLGQQSQMGASDRGEPWAKRAELESEELERSLSKLIGKLPVIMLGVVGVMAMLIMAAIYLPMWSLYSDIDNQIQGV